MLPADLNTVPWVNEDPEYDDRPWRSLTGLQILLEGPSKGRDGKVLWDRLEKRGREYGIDVFVFCKTEDVVMAWHDAGEREWLHVEGVISEWIWRDHWMQVIASITRYEVSQNFTPSSMKVTPNGKRVVPHLLFSLYPILYKPLQHWHSHFSSLLSLNYLLDPSTTRLHNFSIALSLG